MKFRKSEINTCVLTTSIRIWHEKLANQNIKYVRDILNKNGGEYVDDWTITYVKDVPLESNIAFLIQEILKLLKTF